MSYTLTKEFPFEAAHQLIGHDGKCARLHGHSWRLTVELSGEGLEIAGAKKGMLVDYYDIGAAVRPLVENYLDHFFLNETLETDRPTSEFIARWAFDMLKAKLPHLRAVIVSETCTTSCRYEPAPIRPASRFGVEVPYHGL